MIQQDINNYQRKFSVYISVKSAVRIIFLGIIFLAIPSVVGADYLGQRVNFFVDSSYDLTGRSQLNASLQKITNQLYFYIDDIWWDKLDYSQKQKVSFALDSLAFEFEQKIYPTLTFSFGSEPKPGIDKDERITILIHPMIEEAGGYFNSGDGYPKIQYPKSNEREMIYLNSRHLDEILTRIHLAHEFMHLITLNQKEIIRGVTEEIWLNEARAEYTSTLLSYDHPYKGSNLEKRVKTFLDTPHDSLTEWQGKKYDYGAVTLFIQYLVDHYGLKILVDSLHSSKSGIPSIHESLQKNGFKEDFSQIFTDWTIAVLVNDCNLGPKYCYLNPNLKNLRITPQIHFLPLLGQSSFSIINNVKDWAGNWHKIIGGKNILKLEFSGTPGGKFKIPYLIEDLEGKISVNFLKLDEKQKGAIYIPDFNLKDKSLVLIPSAQTKTSGFNDLQPLYQYSFTASIVEKIPEAEAELIKKLLAQIEFLQKEIARLQAEITATQSKKIGTGPFSCRRFENDLYYGMMANSEVKCLQEFLKAQGPEIYPKGLITGNFLNLTRSAVIRFQEKYRNEILTPFGLKKGTGFVGPLTRAKINQLLSR